MDFKRIKDRGMLKWQGFMMPEYIGHLKEADVDYYREPKPDLDEYQIAELESKIHYAMEYNLTLKITIWISGFNEEHIGKVHHADAINKKLKLVNEKGYTETIRFKDIVEVDVIE